MPTLDELGEIVRNWAAAQPRVSAAYLFGSRVKGTHRQDSDIDVAVELFTPKGNPGGFCDWADLADELRASLGSLLSVALDLTQYENPNETPTVHQALVAASMLVYSMDPNQSFEANGCAAAQLQRQRTH
ncbi:MAG: nucleotidyltransferase domain-containing protein [Dokdonella sp.]